MHKLWNFWLGSDQISWQT